MLRGMMLFGIFASLILTVIFISNIISITNPTIIILAMTFIVASYIIMLTAIILWIAGYYNIFKGRREFGPIHTHFVNLSLIFGGLFVFSLIGQVVITAYSMQLMMGNLLFLRIVLGMISTGLLSITWIYLILDIVPSEMKVALWLSLLLSLVISISTAFIGEISPIAGFFGLALWYIVLFIVILCYQRTYNRLKKKEILPMFPPPYPFPFPPQ